MNYNFDNAVNYHYDQFPPKSLNMGSFISQIVKATDAIAIYDQMLKSMHSRELLLAPLRNQEAVITSRMDGTISTMDEILQFEADHKKGETSSNVRSEVIETIFYSRALSNAQKLIEEGYPLTKSLVKTIHQQLLSYGRDSTKSPGEFKTE